MDEVEEVTKIFLASEGRPVPHPKGPLSKAIANIISALVFGNRCVNKQCASAFETEYPISPPYLQIKQRPSMQH